MFLLVVWLNAIDEGAGEKITHLVADSFLPFLPLITGFFLVSKDVNLLISFHSLISCLEKMQVVPSICILLPSPFSFPTRKSVGLRVIQNLCAVVITVSPQFSVYLYFHVWC